jgi:class 3 adenylate cyclase
VARAFVAIGRRLLTPYLRAMPRSFTFDVPFDAPITEVWRVVSDTDLIDAAIGNPAIQYTDEPQPDGTTRRLCRTRKMGFAFVYEEPPFTWIHEQMYEFRRAFTKGAFRTFVHRCELIPREPAGGIVRTTFEFEPMGPLGLIAGWGIRKDLVKPYQRTFERVNRKLQELHANTRSHSVIVQRPLPMDDIATRDPGEPAVRVADFIGRTRRLMDTPLLDKLDAAVSSLPDQELRRMRPRAYARRWQSGFRETLNLFLAATRAGLLKMRWDVICPHCRGDKFNLASLADVKERAFCPSCNIDFDVDLDRSLEAVFTPHPQVRDVPQSHYCLGGPGTTPHIVYQKLFKPDEEHRFTIQLAEGRYRVRFTGEKSYRWIEVAGDGGRPYTDRINKGEGTIKLELRDTEIAGADRTVPPGPFDVRIRNASARNTVCVIESVEWAVDALSAGDLVADQRFRDLFSSEVLAPGIKLAVEDATILFTDVVGSTAMYNTLGDARAFSLVRTHFDVLHEIVQRNEGAIVKTIGDAIMAVFTKPENALKAAAELHTRTDAYVREQGHPQGVQLKIGLHAGPCIAVTLNERLDYFGTAVNLAARVQNLSAGGDILVSKLLADRTGDCGVLRQQGWKSAAEQAQAKGFDQPVPVLRWTR